MRGRWWWMACIFVLLAAGTALLFAAVARLPAALMALGGLLALLAPFGWGLVLAYVLDIPTRFFAQKLFGGRRGWAMGASYALFFGVLALLANSGVGRAPAGAKHHRLCRTADRL